MIERGFTVVCDRCKIGHTEPYPSPKTARADARVLGWITKDQDGVDICPRCAPHRRSPSPTPALDRFIAEHLSGQKAHPLPGDEERL